MFVQYHQWVCFRGHDIREDLTIQVSTKGPFTGRGVGWWQGQNGKAVRLNQLEATVRLISVAKGTVQRCILSLVLEEETEVALIVF